MWIVEVKVSGHWKAMRMSDGTVYEYETAEMAAKMACMSYPDQAREDRLDQERKHLRLYNYQTFEYDDVWKHAR